MGCFLKKRKDAAKNPETQKNYSILISTFATAWIDYKKAYDMVPQSWIINCLKMYRKMRHATNEKRQTTPYRRNETTKSRENENAWRKGKLQILGYLGS